MSPFITPFHFSSEESCMDTDVTKDISYFAVGHNLLPLDHSPAQPKRGL